MPSILNTISTCLLNPVIGCADLYKSSFKSNHFEDISEMSSGVLAFIIILALVLWIMTLISTYRLTHSGLQVVLCLFFGSFYISCAWIYYGYTNNKVVKNVKNN